MYVSRIDIRNMRCFAHASVDLAYPGVTPKPAHGPPNVTLLLGENGTGKTTVLKAIAHAVLGEALRDSSYSPYSLVRRVRAERVPPALVTATVHLAKLEVPGLRARTGDVSLELRALPGTRRDKLGRSTLLSPSSARAYARALEHNAARSLFMVAYGSRRWSERPQKTDRSARDRARLPRHQRVASLIDDDPAFALVPPDAWLPELMLANPGRFAQVASLLAKLGPPDDEEAFGIDEAHLHRAGELVFRQHGAQVPFHALSDGYRGFYGWLTDLLFHVVNTTGTGKRLSETEGVVLVDEIDLFLHPRWQRVVIEKLVAAFPRLQFVLTTHSPLVAGGLGRAQLRVMARDKKGGTTVEVPDVDLFGKSADQILLSPAFDMPSVRAPLATERIEKLAVGAAGGSAKAARDLMRALAGELA
jgi:DNA polymerase III delta prime subunit